MTMLTDYDPAEEARLQAQVAEATREDREMLAEFRAEQEGLDPESAEYKHLEECIEEREYEIEGTECEIMGWPMPWEREGQDDDDDYEREPDGPREASSWEYDRLEDRTFARAFRSPY
jgi:hypothetical protein